MAECGAEGCDVLGVWLNHIHGQTSSKMFATRGGQAPPPQYHSLEMLLIFIHAAQISVYYIICMPRARGGCKFNMLMRQTPLLGFVKSTFSIGYVGAEAMHQLIPTLGNLQGHVLLA